MNPSLTRMVTRLPGVSRLVAKIEQIDRRLAAMEYRTSAGSVAVDSVSVLPDRSGIRGQPAHYRQDTFQSYQGRLP